MLIATFNCNSVRMRLGTILAWLEKYSPEVLALQETKCPDEAFPQESFTEAGWKVVFRGQKSYNGVALVTKEEPAEVRFGLEDGDDGQSQPRLACIKLGKIWVLNTYVPQGRSLDSESFIFKLEWFVRLRDYLKRNFNPTRNKVVWVGDLNVAPAPIDVYDSKAVWPHVCHCQEVIEAFEDVAAWGLVDIFRKHIPGEGVFTFWDYRAGRDLKGRTGWRIDHILATEVLAKTSRECFVDTGPRKGPRPSDHTFVAARFEI